MKPFDAWLDDTTTALREREALASAPACDTCQDTGETMGMVCYGGPIVEKMIACPDCVGLEDYGKRQLPHASGPKLDH